MIRVPSADSSRSSTTRPAGLPAGLQGGAISSAAVARSRAPAAEKNSSADITTGRRSRPPTKSRRARKMSAHAAVHVRSGRPSWRSTIYLRQRRLRPRPRAKINFSQRSGPQREPDQPGDCHQAGGTPHQARLASGEVRIDQDIFPPHRGHRREELPGPATADVPAEVRRSAAAPEPTSSIPAPPEPRRVFDRQNDCWIEAPEPGRVVDVATTAAPSTSAFQ